MNTAFARFENCNNSAALRDTLSRYLSKEGRTIQIQAGNNTETIEYDRAGLSKAKRDLHVPVFSLDFWLNTFAMGSSLNRISVSDINDHTLKDIGLTRTQVMFGND